MVSPIHSDNSNSLNQSGNRNDAVTPSVSMTPVKPFLNKTITPADSKAMNFSFNDKKDSSNRLEEIKERVVEADEKNVRLRKRVKREKLFSNPTNHNIANRKLRPSVIKSLQRKINQMASSAIKEVISFNKNRK